MRHFRWPALCLLAAYSAVLLSIEARTSQQFVRNFFTDVTGPVPFYAVNTTLGVSLLWGAATLFAFGGACLGGPAGQRRVSRFFLAQAAVFAYLGCDDRFQLHEKIGGRLGVGDHYILLAVAAAEIALIARFARRDDFRGRPGIWFALGVALGAVMLFIDACLPEMMWLRLSLEDLAKTWSAAMFFLFAWDSVALRVGALPRAVPLVRGNVSVHAESARAGAPADNVALVP